MDVVGFVVIIKWTELKKRHILFELTQRLYYRIYVQKTFLKQLKISPHFGQKSLIFQKFKNS